MYTRVAHRVKIFLDLFSNRATVVLDMAKQPKNQIALQSNEASLEKAKTDLSRAQNTVTKLVQKIPELERACAALRVLCDVKPKASVLSTATAKEKLIAMVTEEAEQHLKTEPAYEVPPEIAAKLPVEDLSQMGSVPAVTGEAAPAAPDDEDFYLNVDARVEP